MKYILFIYFKTLKLKITIIIKNNKIVLNIINHKIKEKKYYYYLYHYDTIFKKKKKKKNKKKKEKKNNYN